MTCNTTRTPATQRGVTLMELLIVVVVVGILSAIALPTYQGYLVKARRSDGRSALLDLSARMEKYFYQNGSYSGATAAGLLGTTDSPEGFYSLAIAAATGTCPIATCYELQATPVAGGSQADDSLCASLIFRSSGVKSAGGSCGSDSVCADRCW